MTNNYIEDTVNRERLHVADTKKRVLAYFIDDLLISLVVALIIWERLSAAQSFEQIALVVNEAVIEVMLLKFLYQSVFVYLYGATIGKIIIKIRVIEIATIDKPTFGAAVNRALVRIVSELIFYFGFILAYFDQFKQTLHDKAAKTIVIEYKEESIA